MLLISGVTEVELMVREIQIEDAEAIVNILNPIIEAGFYTAFDTPFTVEAEQQYILQFPQHGVFHVAISCHEQKIVGFQSMEPFANYTHAFDRVEVLGTYVALSYRRQGISKSLFEVTFDSARSKGYEKLFTFVRADNQAALATYLNQGFYIVGTATRQAKVKGIYVDEIIVERFL